MAPAQGWAWGECTMSMVGGTSSKGLVARVQGILLRPKLEWDIIDLEAATVPGLFTGYAVILAAIAPIALIIQSLLFLHWALPLTIVWALITYVGGLVGTFILGVVIDALAPSFDGQKNRVQAMKLAVYSYTAAWVAGTLNIVPALGILAILAGLYGLYILYLGLPKLMRAPQDKTMGYFAVSVIVAIVINAIIGAIISAVVVAMTAGALFGAASPYAHAANAANLARIEAASAQISAAAARTEATTAAQAASGATSAAATTAIDPEKLKALLPTSVAGLDRTEISATSAGAAGIGGSEAEATYAKGAATITVKVTDLAAMGAMAGMAGAMNVTTNKQTATGYEKVGKVDGRLTSEEWDSSGKSGKYGVLVADRFMIDAEGSGTSMNDLKSAVAAVGPDRLQGMAKS